MSKETLDTIKTAVAESGQKSLVKKGSEVLERTNQMVAELDRQKKKLTGFAGDLEKAIESGDVVDAIGVDHFIDEHKEGRFVAQGIGNVGMPRRGSM